MHFSVCETQGSVGALETLETLGVCDHQGRFNSLLGEFMKTQNKIFFLKHPHRSLPRNAILVLALLKLSNLKIVLLGTYHTKHHGTLDNCEKVRCLN